MAHSLCVIYLHLVFSTKDRLPQILTGWKTELYAYIGGIIKNLQGDPITIGGTNDHIHILCTLPKNTDISTYLRNIKASSSKWVHLHYDEKFNWQDGYGAFSVGASNLQQVKNYISNQEIHHQNIDYQHEYDTMLKLLGLKSIAKFKDSLHQ